MDVFGLVDEFIPARNLTARSAKPGLRNTGELLARSGGSKILGSRLSSCRSDDVGPAVRRRLEGDAREGTGAGT